MNIHESIRKNWWTFIRLLYARMRGILAINVVTDVKLRRTVVGDSEWWMMISIRVNDCQRIYLDSNFAIYIWARPAVFHIFCFHILDLFEYVLFFQSLKHPQSPKTNFLCVSFTFICQFHEMPVLCLIWLVKIHIPCNGLCEKLPPNYCWMPTLIQSTPLPFFF